MSKQQFGFQSKRNTTDAMFNLVFDVYTGINGGEGVAAVFCDLSKAFDCVDYEILLRKLQYYGFRRVSYRWIKSYLIDRRQIVKTAELVGG